MNVNVSRPLTRLKSDCVSLIKDYIGNTAPTTIIIRTAVGRQEWNCFVDPMFDEFDAEAQIHSSSGELAFTFKIK